MAIQINNFHWCSDLISWFLIATNRQNDFKIYIVHISYEFFELYSLMLPFFTTIESLAILHLFNKERT
jgi:hypothetical protein